EPRRAAREPRAQRSLQAANHVWRGAPRSLRFVDRGATCVEAEHLLSIRNRTGSPTRQGAAPPAIGVNARTTRVLRSTPRTGLPWAGFHPAASHRRPAHRRSNVAPVTAIPSRTEHPGAL